MDNNHHWIWKQWSAKEHLVPGKQNILYPALLNRDRIILPPYDSGNNEEVC